MDVNFFQMLLIYHHILYSICLKCGTLCGNETIRNRIYSGPAVEELKDQTKGCGKCHKRLSASTSPVTSRGILINTLPARIFVFNMFY